LKFVFNSTPLIHLAKAGLAWTIDELEGEKYTTPKVYREVVEVGKEGKFDDAPVVEDLIKRRVIFVREPPKELLEFIAENHKDLHSGEAEVISLAKSLKAIAIIDDPVARRIAEIHGVKKEGTYAIIIRMLLKGKMNKEQARASLQKLVSSGWRCDVELYNMILKSIETLTHPSNE